MGTKKIVNKKKNELPKDYRNRMRAARALHDWSYHDLADAVNEVGMGAATLQRAESGQATPAPRDLRAIAIACGVPYAFFTADLKTLGMDEETRALHATITGLRTDLDSFTLRFAALAARVEALEQRVHAPQAR